MKIIIIITKIYIKIKQRRFIGNIKFKIKAIFFHSSLFISVLKQSKTSLYCKNLDADESLFKE